jgi:hypothetical protein
LLFLKWVSLLCRYVTGYLADSPDTPDGAANRQQVLQMVKAAKAGLYKLTTHSLKAPGFGFNP